VTARLASSCLRLPSVQRTRAPNGRRPALDALVAAVVTVAVAGAALVEGASERAVAAGAGVTAVYAAAGPHRLADTRAADCGCVRVDARTIRVRIAGRFGLPNDLTAAAVTVTATRVGADGFLTAFPSGQTRPETSTLNVWLGRDRANSAIVPIGADGSIDVWASGPADVVVDVTGVFVAAVSATSGRFVPLPPTRIADTRRAGSPITRLAPGGTAHLPLPPGVPPDATALAVNVTSVGAPRAGFFSLHPASVPATTSVLNVDGSGDPAASGVITPVHASGLNVETTAGGDLVVDLTGYFTGPSAPDATDGLFVAVAPTRVVDTRTNPQRLWPGGTREIAMPVAAAVATNVTVDRTDDAGFVTAYPAGTTQPDASTVNATTRNDTVANLALSPTSTRGVAYFSDRGTDLVVDLTGWFTGTPMPAVAPPRPNVRPPSRTLLIGDSTLAAVRWYGTAAPLAAQPYRLDAESCRRLAAPSCRGREGYRPTNAVTAINDAPGWWDVVVIMAGYDDWWIGFPDAFHEVVDAAKAKGARTIVWLTFREGVPYVSPGGDPADEAYVINNAALVTLADDDAFPPVVLADWKSYTAARPSWVEGDGVHLTATGAYGVADYLARTVAHLDGRACPAPWTPGGPTDAPCPDPDVHGPPADVRALYP
jgi:hypothetical protein